MFPVDAIVHRIWSACSLAMRWMRNRVRFKRPRTGPSIRRKDIGYLTCHTQKDLGIRDYPL